MKKLSLAGALVARLLLLFVGVGIGESAFSGNESPNLRPSNAEKALLERKQREERARKIKGVDCTIKDRVVNKNKHITCIYKCPNGKTESESVEPGLSCPPIMNVIAR
jgi:hypothetical protein